MGLLLCTNAPHTTRRRSIHSGFTVAREKSPVAVGGRSPRRRLRETSRLAGRKSTDVVFCSPAHAFRLRRRDFAPSETVDEIKSRGSEPLALRHWAGRLKTTITRRPMDARGVE